jgi:arylsulfatase A-like enzyme
MLSRVVITTLMILTGVSHVFAQNGKQPNVLFIFADDQSFNTIHALGNDEIQTPNLDSLVKRGTTFTRAYNMGGWNGAVCIASRTMLVTGRFLGQAEQVDRKVDRVYRQAGRLWPQRLAAVGYDTYFSGKWHIKANAEKAFTVCRHVRPGMPNQTPAGYNRPVEGQQDKWSPYDTSFDGFWKGGKHWSEVLGDDGVDYLEMAGESDKPFFMYLAFNAPHDPRQSPKEFVDRYPLNNISVPKSFLPEYPFKDNIGCSAKLRDEKLAPFPRTEYSVKVNRQEYYAIITHMDQQIGRLLKALQETGKADNTWIFFTADHGLSCGHHGLMGKQNMFDHSVRVPFMVVGPGVAAGVKNETPIYLQDAMATTLELAGLNKQDDVQYKSLLPLLRGSRDTHYDAIFSAYTRVQRAITFGDYKLIVYPTIKKTLLFNLKQDPAEMKDLSEDPKSQAILKACFQKLVAQQKVAADTLDVKSLFPELMEI